MKKSSAAGGGKLERKEVEKNRRMHMKSLCFKLSSIIPKDYYTFSISKDNGRYEDNIEQAVSYIKTLRERIEKLKKTKELAASINGAHNDLSNGVKSGSDMCVNGAIIEVRPVDSNLEVIVVSGIEKSFGLHEVIKILREEGTDVINASFSVVGDKIFHSLHCRPISYSAGFEESRISERLNELVE